MIVHLQTDGSLTMIAQTSHAELSGMLAARWGNEVFTRPRPYQSVVRAAIHHDSGWCRYEARPAYDVNAKSTPSFTQVPADAVQLAAYQWAIDWMTDIDPYAGLLISRHRTGLWKERYGTVSHPAPPPRRVLSEGVIEFVDRNEARQQHALESLNQHEFLVNYHNLQVWDLLSLYLCGVYQLKEQNFDFALTGYALGEDKSTRLKLTPIGNDRVEIRPYPFDVRPFKVHYAYRQLYTNDYPTEEAFREAYFAAIPKLKHWEFD